MNVLLALASTHSALDGLHSDIVTHCLAPLLNLRRMQMSAVHW